MCLHSHYVGIIQVPFLGLKACMIIQYVSSIHIINCIFLGAILSTMTCAIMRRSACATVTVLPTAESSQ